MMKVAPLPYYLLMLPGQQFHGLLAALAAFFASGHPTLRPFQRFLSFPVMAWVLNHRSIGQGQKGLEAHINARLLSSQRQGLRRNISAREASIPAINFSGNGHRLGRADHRTMQAESHPAYLRQGEDTPIQRDTVAVLWIGQTVVAIAP